MGHKSDLLYHLSLQACFNGFLICLLDFTCVVEYSLLYALLVIYCFFMCAREFYWANTETTRTKLALFLLLLTSLAGATSSFPSTGFDAHSTLMSVYCRVPDPARDNRDAQSRITARYR